MSKLMGVNEIAKDLFGESTAGARARVIGLIKKGELLGEKIGTAQSSPYYIQRESYERYLENFGNAA